MLPEKYLYFTRENMEKMLFLVQMISFQFLFSVLSELKWNALAPFVSFAANIGHRVCCLWLNCNLHYLHSKLICRCTFCSPGVLLKTLCDKSNRIGEIGYFLASFEAAITHIQEIDLSEDRESMLSFASTPLTDISLG